MDWLLNGCDGALGGAGGDGVLVAELYQVYLVDHP